MKTFLVLVRIERGTTLQVVTNSNSLEDALDKVKNAYPEKEVITVMEREDMEIL